MITAAALNVLGGCASVNTAVHPDWINQPSRRIAVLPFQGVADLDEDIASALVIELVNEGHAVIERSRLDQIFQEQAFQHSGAVDPRTLAAAGHLTGVDFIVLGSYSTRRSVPTVEWFLGEGREIDQLDSVNVRWINVRNGQVMASASLRNLRGQNLQGVAKKMVRSFDAAVKSVLERAQVKQPNTSTYSLTPL